MKPCAARLRCSEGARARRRVRIEEEFDPSLPPLLGNADGLVHVLINLLSNAMRGLPGMAQSPA